MDTDWHRTLSDLARRLDDAQQARTETPSLERDPDVSVDLDVDTAYAIQNEVVRRREGRGERTIGVKLGFTSREKMAQMGVDEIIVGRLTDAMAVPAGGEVELARFIHPKIEPEVAYRISTDVDLDDLGFDDALDAFDVHEIVDAVAPAMEIIDSRYVDFVFTFADVIADNTSAAGFVVGEWSPLRAVPDNAVTLVVGETDAGPATTKEGTTSAILGDPENALREMLRQCRRHGIPLRTGDVVLAGAATAAVALGAGPVTCAIDGLGEVSVRGV